MLSILIPEKIPAHNKGEEAIFRGICKTLELQGNIYKIYLYSDSPEYDGMRYGNGTEIITSTLIPNSDLTRQEKLLHLMLSGFKHIAFLLCPKSFREKIFKDKLWKAYSEVDLIILGHDNAFSFVHNILILFCKIMKKKVVMYGASILPHVYEKTIPRMITRYCLMHLDLITLREPKSRDFLENVGIDSARLHVTADKAFLLEPVDKDKASELLRENNVINDNRPLIGMTVVYGSGVFKRGLINYKDPVEKYAVYTDVMARVVDFLVDELGGKVIFMPHTIGPSKQDDDRVVSRDVYEKIIRKDDVHLIEGDYSASELKGMIGCCDFFIGARTHSVIAATSMGVPSIVLSYPKDFRTYGIIGDMLGQTKWVYNIEYLQAGDLIELIRNAWVVRHDTMRELPDVVKHIMERALLNGTLLKDVIEKN